jgi:hypothetical protein
MLRLKMRSRRCGSGGSLPTSCPATVAVAAAASSVSDAQPPSPSAAAGCLSTRSPRGCDASWYSQLFCRALPSSRQRSHSAIVAGQPSSGSCLLHNRRKVPSNHLWPTRLRTPGVAPTAWKHPPISRASRSLRMHGPSRNGASYGEGYIAEVLPVARGGAAAERAMAAGAPGAVAVASQQGGGCSQQPAASRARLGPAGGEAPGTSETSQRCSYAAVL